jgi:4-hydroxybenzoate polyprenyltransferase
MENAGARNANPSSVRAYLELCRIYLAPTAIADSLAGFALASALLEPATHPTTLLLIAGTSVLLYAAGMVTNDIFDVEKDRERDPSRPLVCGSVSRVAAVLFALALCAGAGGLAAAAGALLPASIVLALSIAYNAGAKRVPVIGNLVMGGCRSGNFLLGAVAGGIEMFAIGPVLLASLLLGLFIATVTAVSLLEDAPSRKLALVALCGSTLILPAALPLLAHDSRSILAWIAWIALAVQLLVAIVATLRRAPGVPPAAIFVRRALGAIPTVDAALLLTFAPTITGVVIPVLGLYCIGILAWWCKRRWLQSGGSET